MDFMGNPANHNSGTTQTRCAGHFDETQIQKMVSAAADALQFPAEVVSPIRHLYVHIPFCARICPYCAFYKDLLDRSQTSRFCEAILSDLDLLRTRFAILPETIYFGGGTPTALTTGQLEFLLKRFAQHLDLSSLQEWTIEANPGSVSARKAALLRSLGITRISLGVQSWNDDLLKLLGREHNARQAEESFRLLRAAGFSNINVDLMFGLPGQTIEQWKLTLEKTIALQPDHISAYCLTYEEDTEFFLRHARGEFRQDVDSDAEFFELAMSTLENETATPNFSSWQCRRWKMPATNITKFRITRVWASRRFTIMPIGLAKIIWASGRAQFQPSVCSAGRMSAIIAPILIVYLLADHPRHRPKL